MCSALRAAADTPVIVRDRRIAADELLHLRRRDRRIAAEELLHLRRRDRRIAADELLHLRRRDADVQRPARCCRHR
jgi:hypothetical protein